MTTRLTGLDASFLYAETEATPMHTLEVMVVERPPTDRRRPEEVVRAALERALERLPALRVRAVEGSALGHPRWEEAPVDLDRHVRFERLWSRSDEDASRAIAAHLEGTLPRDRPLWSLLVLVHPGSRRLTLALKHHHALTDGVGFARMLEVLAGQAEPIAYEGPPRRGLWARARALFALIASSIAGLWRSRAHRQPLPFRGGRWAFNAPVGPRRRLARAKLPLAQLRRARTALAPDATINDLLLSLVAGALRGLGAARGEDVGRALIAAQPVALERRPHDRGNFLSALLAPLHVEIDDPKARLEATRDATVAAKAAHQARGRELVARWSELLPGAVLRVFWSAIRALPRPPANVVVSNVVGAATVLPLGAARLEEVYLVGPLLPTTGLNVTFYRHADAVFVCVLSADTCEPRAVADAIVADLDALAADAPRDSLAA
ncbi:MAG: DUF1298 domain-containing protein [Sandaracinaceae bacterium]|nr:DUF1298 domain-containing protein [Sandaracinaceae bacterium]